MPDIFTSKLDTFITIGIILLLLLLLYNNRKSSLTSIEDSPRLGVQELVEKVRTELIEIDKKRIKASEAALFELKDFELEINFVVKENSTQKGDFDFKVVTVGGETNFGSEKTQKITLRMTASQPQQQESPATDNTTRVLDTPPLPENKKQ